MARVTVLQCVQRACYALNVTPPVSLFSSTDPNALQWLHLFYDVGESIRDRYDYPTLKRKYEFDLVLDQKLYPMPGDYWRFLLDTQWDLSNNWPLYGPEDDGGIVNRDYGIVPYGVQYSFRVAGAQSQTVVNDSFTTNGGYFEVSPAPVDTNRLYFEYITANWFMPIQWAASAAITASALVSANGNIYQAGATGTTNTVRPTGESTTAGETGVAFQLYRDHFDIITADTNYPIIDPHIIQLGLRYKYLEAKGLDASGMLMAFELALSNGISRFAGTERVNGAGQSVYEYPVLEDGFITEGW